MKRLAIILSLLLASVVNGQGKGYKPLSPEKRAAMYKASAEKHGGRLAMLARFQALPAAFDCRDKGWVLPVGDQANCGSCYLYSTVYGTMTQAFVKAGYGKADGSFVMAVQYGMDCHDFGGCNGGNGTEVIDWACKNGWYAEKWVDVSGASHADYPAYSANSHACRPVAGAKKWTPADWGFVSASQNRPATVLEIKTALVNFGPLNVSLDAGGQFGNGTGTITSLGSNIDHEIELVAFDDAKGAFLLKNQWTTDWGNAGYRWLTYGAAQRLVDVFFVTAAPLPVPPPPPIPVPPDPVPPGPIPPGPVGAKRFTLSGFGPYDGTYDALPTGTLDMTVRQLVNGKVEVPPVTSAEPPVLPKMPASVDDGTKKRLDSLEQRMDRVLKLLEKIAEPQKSGSAESLVSEPVAVARPKKANTAEAGKYEFIPDKETLDMIARIPRPPGISAINPPPSLTIGQRNEWWQKNYPQYAATIK